MSEANAKEVPQRFNLPVGGMTCAACVGHVDEALRKAPGVADVSVNLITRAALVTLAEGALTPEKKAETIASLIEVVERAGYYAHAPDEEEDVLADQRRADASLAEESRGRLVRAIVALSAAILAMILSMPLMHGSEHDRFSAALMGVIDPPLSRAIPWLYTLDRQRLLVGLLCLFGPVLLWVLGPIAKRAWAAARNKTTDMNTLVVLGASASLASSFLGDVAVDAALFIVGFVLLGQAAEGRARGRTSAALSALANLRVDVAHRELEDGSLLEVKAEALRVGDRVVVRPGERLPGDGVVDEGEGHTLEAILTGESRPVPKGVGAEVLGGSINGDQPLKVRLTRLGKNSTLHQLLRLLREAQAQRAPTQRLADRVASIFVPSMIGLALLTFGTWWALDGVEVAARYAVAVLVVACPCAMGLAVPTAIVVATGKAARAGILVKGGDVLERFAAIQRVVFDKTGTLTEGQPTVARRVVLAAGRSEAELLALAAGLEKSSEHPLARGIAAAAAEASSKPLRVKSLENVAGAGLIGMVEGRAVGIGNRRILERLGLSAEVRARAEQAAQAEESPLFVVDGAEVLGFLTTQDRLRDDAVATIRALTDLGVESQILTGDRRATALSVAQALGLGEAAVTAEVLPAEKVAQIERSRAERATAFVGDGVNDAAALAAAHVGIGISEGSEVAVAAADVALLRPRLAAIPELLALSRRTKRLMIQNLGWAFGYNLVMLPLAMGLLSPWGLRLSPVLAAVAMSMSSVTVVLNSLRLQRFRMGP